MFNKDFYYDGGEYKIIEPNNKVKEEILKRIINYSKDKKENKVDMNSYFEFLLWMCKELVKSDNKKYDFNKYDINYFTELLEGNTPIILEEIINVLIDLSTKIQTNFMMQQKLKIRQQYIEFLSSQIDVELDYIQKEIVKDAKFEKKVKDLKRINKLNKEGLNDKRKEVERLDKLIQGKNNKKKFFNKKNKKNK